MLFEHITIVTIITGIDITDITVIDIITDTIERNFLVKRAAVAYRSRAALMFPASRFASTRRSITQHAAMKSRSADDRLCLLRSS